ncbi:hypothetical protein MTQ12_13805 [Brevibacterium sp. R8603A2]|uniref:hypothetical protein n=1 Tax=Brevibacterium sp. R8603A2 TaxID=2929779 RepID=UPI001FF71F62|nr:hypothetical protein [Brevibacterium sp. R8603A2]MCK1804111.1 hypothetical protein [Brevibacterium sp. R8603A2]
MFVIFGFGKRQRPQGPGALRDCPRCHNTTRWNRMREFSQFTLFLHPHRALRPPRVRDLRHLHRLDRGVTHPQRDPHGPRRSALLD